MSPKKKKGKGGAKGAAKGKPKGPKSAKTEQTTRCDLPAERIESFFDTEAGAPDALLHVPACDPCATSLTAFAAQRFAVKELATLPPGVTVIEHVLARGARAGTRKLADLVYELTKACLVAVGDIDRRVRMEVRPRSQGEIRKDVASVTTRLPSPKLSSAARKLPATEQKESTALIGAASCVSILEQLEGKSDRQQLGKAVLLITTGRPHEAELLLTKALDGGMSKENRRHAYHNLIWALIRQDRWADALEVGDKAVAAAPLNWALAFNLVAAAARSRQRPLFEKFSKKLRSLPRQANEGAMRDGDILQFELPRMAADLSMSEESVSRAVGLSIMKSGSTYGRG